MAKFKVASGRRYLALAVLLLALATDCGKAQTAAAAAGALYVSPVGNDGGEGTEGSPLRTIGQALKLAAPGTTIAVAAGQYPPFRTNRLFAEPVTIRGEGEGNSIVQADPELQSEGAIEFWGAAGVVIEGLTVRGGRIFVTDERNHTLQRGSADIVLREDELVGEDGTGGGVTIRSGSKRIAIERCFIHDMVSAITGPNYRIISGVDNGLPLVEGVTIRDNRIEQLKEDALQFADWQDVVVEGNVMRGAMHDPPPAPQYHNDLIQFTGYSNNVRIASNYLADSAQEIFIQPAFGPIEDVVVENNALWNSRAYAVQSQAVTGLRFVHNTLWASSYGMIIRGGPHEEPAATDGVVVGNIVEKLAYPNGTVEHHNLVGAPQRTAGYGRDDLLGVEPDFAAPAEGDLHLSQQSPAIGAGDPSYAPPTDLEGRQRAVPPSLGAYEPLVPTPEPPKNDGQPGAPDPTPGGSGDSGRGGRTQAVPAALQEQPAAQPGTHTVLLVVRLPRRQALVTTARLKTPGFCLARCTVTAAGRVVLRGVSGVGSALLKPQRAPLSSVLSHGLRLSARQRISPAPRRGPLAVAQLQLRFADQRRRSSSSLLVRFSRRTLRAAPGRGGTGS